MKYILFFLFSMILSTQAKALSFAQRVDALGDVEKTVRVLARKCSLEQGNMAAFIVGLKQAEDETKLTCLESKVLELQTEEQAKIEQKSAKTEARGRVKAKTDAEVRNMSVPLLNEFVLDLKKSMGL